MLRKSRISFINCACTVMAALLVWAATTAAGVAQFGLPKIPKLPKVSKSATSEVKPSRAATMEVVSTISPDSAPPGGHGQVVVTGQNFKAGMQVTFNCKGSQFKADSVKVESATKAVAQIQVPVTAEEGPCGTSMRSTSSKAPFQISNSANLPVSVPMGFLGEGDMQYMDMMMKMQQAMAPGFGNQGAQGRIEFEGSSIKYVQGDKTTFTESISGVKSMGEMKQGDKPIGIFRIVFNDGKIYNFMGGQQATDAHAVFVFLQKKLGK
jgi:hypothetical protein